MRIHVVTFSPKDSRCRYPVKKENPCLTCLSQIDRQLRKFRATRHVRLHNFGAAREESNINVRESVRRNNLRNLNISSELLKQTRIFFSFKKSEPACRKASILEHLAQFFSQERGRSNNRDI